MILLLLLVLGIYVPSLFACIQSLQLLVVGFSGSNGLATGTVACDAEMNNPSVASLVRQRICQNCNLFREYLVFVFWTAVLLDSRLP